MAILDFNKDNEKSIAIYFHSQERGPEGQPVYYSTPEAPAVITGYVEFRTIKELHGHDITLNFQARAESKWTEHYGQTTVSYHGLSILQEKSWDVPLNRVASSSSASDKKIPIAAGVTRYEFQVELEPSLPPTLEGKNGWFHYRFKAHLARDFPRRNMAIKQCVWVYSSTLTESQILRMEPRIYRTLWQDVLPVTCMLPSDLLYQGQIVPLKVQIGAFTESSSFRGQSLIIDSAMVKMKQYTILMEPNRLYTSKRKHKKTVFILPIMNNPQNEAEAWNPTHSNHGFERIVMVELPGARQLAADLESKALNKTHCLKLIMMVRPSGSTDPKDAKELRVEMEVRITSPRPEFVKQTQHQQVLISSNNVAPPPYQPNLIDLDDDGASQLGRPSMDDLPPLHDSYEASTEYPVEKKSITY
ncbi:hypothetical protein EMPS_02788 [Entomortierella parvispora]|uniref:Arrestin-like N-terminal domain-containing protein n=1 Tax=Entomortierella parvispora TaxID=205924 RepID=A0A9P3H5D6_9FUNG|nr:hypothetical protein EMPS_02788 [Entomortierella parvispora]